MNDLELAGLLIGGVVVGAIVLKTKPDILKNITAKLPSLTPQPQITPISDVYPQPTITPSKGCPPGTYRDYTDGILTCRSTHRARELNPYVKKMIPDQQWAFGKTVDNNYWGYASSPISDEIARLPSLETMLPPSLKDIQKTIDHQKKKRKDHKLVDEKPSHIKKEYDPHKRKLAEVPGGGISVQMECPHDLSKLNCGSHCTKNGKVYQVVCGAETKPHKTRPVRTPPSLTVPPNFPGAVTISPGETPYPEQDTGGTTDISGTDTGGTTSGGEPDWNPPENDTSGVITTPPTPLPHRQPQIGPITPEPPRQPEIGAPLPSGGQTFYPFRPESGKSSRGTYDSNGCAPLHYGSGPDGRTCRWVANNDEMQRRIGDNGYMIKAQLRLGDKDNEHDKEISITSGGPGSSKGNCCGFTARVNIDTGVFQFEAEGPAKTEASFCKGGGCVDSGLQSIGKNLYNKDVSLTWICTKSGGHATYQAIATGPAGTMTSKKFTGLRVRGQELIPFKYISHEKIASDPHRVRVDSCKNVTFKNISVTVIPQGSYFGGEGYII